MISDKHSDQQHLEIVKFRVELAEGQHDKELAMVARLLAFIGRFWAPALLVVRAIPLLLYVNRTTILVPDGQGGKVPISNSRVHPTNGRFIKWTPLDGWVYDDWIGGKVQEKILSLRKQT